MCWHIIGTLQGVLIVGLIFWNQAIEDGFQKGIKTIKTNLEKKTVTIEYDADKTNVQNIIAGFEKKNYKATEVKEEKK